MANRIEYHPPAQPTYVLRGHSAQIHAVHFFRKNSRLLTGDADGWAVLWNTTTKRGVAVWKAHKSTILGLSSWDGEKIITHGRDNKLNVWQIKPSDEPTFSTTLPIDDAAAPRQQPWLLHSLAVNALNFCAFTSARTSNPEELLIATPGVQDGHVNVTSLPSETRIATVPNPKDTNTGMVMAIGLHLLPGSPWYDPGNESPSFQVLAGYESGHVAVFQQQQQQQQVQRTTSIPQPPASPSAPAAAPHGRWMCTYLSKPHTQPILSLCLCPSLTQSSSFFSSSPSFLTSSADAFLARHPLPSSPSILSSSSSSSSSSPSSLPTKVIPTKHAGQQSLKLRSDSKIFATAGWDGRVRVYDAGDMSELAVLKWHREGCYALDFGEVLPEGQQQTSGEEDAGGGSEMGKKIAGKDGDGWEEEGEKKDGPEVVVVVARAGEDGRTGGAGEGKKGRRTMMMTVAGRRAEKAGRTHWVAVGSKDGKVSLWDIY